MRAVRGKPPTPEHQNPIMALYHVHVKTFSRGKGDSAVAACAYRLGVSLHDERTGRTHDYTKRRGVYVCFSCVPDDAPTWANNPGACWQNAEAAEKRRDACVAREFEFSLPRELTPEQNEALARDVAQRLVDRFGFVACVGLHDFHTQPHAHILATTRAINADGFGPKTRELDNRASGTVDEVRAMIGARINHALAAAGHSVRVDHRSHADQHADAIESGDLARAVELAGKVPTVHEGKGPRARRRRDRNKQVRARNADHAQRLVTTLEAATSLDPTPIPPHPLSTALRPADPFPPTLNGETTMQTMNTVQDVEYVEASAGAIYAPNSKRIPPNSRFVSVAAYEWALRHCEKLTHVDMSEPVRVLLTFHDRSTLADHGNRLSASGGTPREQAERMCALAVAKNWTGIEFNGSPDFLREAFAQALRHNLPVHAQDDEQRALLIELETARHAPKLLARSGLAAKLDARTAREEQSAPSPRHRSRRLPAP